MNELWHNQDDDDDDDDQVDDDKMICMTCNVRLCNIYIVYIMQTGATGAVEVCNNMN